MNLENLVNKIWGNLKDAGEKLISNGRNLACATLIPLILAVGAEKVRADIITWYYEDDFSTTKAADDSYDHSRFGAEMEAPPPFDPCLFYSQSAYPPKMLVFGGTAREDAFLAYAFPLDNVLTQVDSGIFEIDVLFRESAPSPGYLLYKLSQDGVNWTNPSPLSDGFNEFTLLPSSNPFIYIRLSGNDVAIDNLSVTVTGTEIPEPSTLVLLGIGLTGLLAKRKYQLDK